MCTGSRWQNVKTFFKDLDQKSLLYTHWAQFIYYNTVLSIPKSEFINI